MKKMLALALGVFMIVGATLFVGCGSKSVFDGNYEEVQVSEVQAFVTELQEAEKSTSLDYLVGSAVKLSMEAEYSGAKQEMSVDCKVVTDSKDGIQLSGSEKGKTYYPKTEYSEESKFEATADVYYKSGYMYFNGTQNGEKEKYKIESNVSSGYGFLESFTGGYIRSSNLDVAEMLNAVLGADASYKWKCYMDSSDNGTKIKFAYTHEHEGTLEYALQEEVAEIIFVFDKDKNITAVKLFSTIINKDSEGKILSESETEMTVESWSGTISLPSDLDTYPEK